MAAHTERFEVQARLVERHGREIVRDETRLASATSLNEAERHAHDHLAAGFTVWIFHVTQGCPQPVYSAVETWEARTRTRKR